MRPVEQTTALVTGATDGLGRSVATELASHGATVLVHGRDPARGERTVAEIRSHTENARRRLWELSERLAGGDALPALRGVSAQGKT